MGNNSPTGGWDKKPDANYKKTMSNSVFVGNLAWSVSWQDLKDHMREAGDVQYSKVITDHNGRSKGYGIVEFSTVEGAQDAIEELTGTELKGRKIFIREDRENDRRGGDKKKGKQHSTDINYHDELMFQQSHSPNSTGSNQAGIPDTWMLLDNQSSIDVFSNGKLLTRVYKSKSTLRIRCNAGVRTTNLRGYVTGYGWVWYYPKGIANILSLSRVKDRFRITYDSEVGNRFQAEWVDTKFRRGPSTIVLL